MSPDAGPHTKNAKELWVMYVQSAPHCRNQERDATSPQEPPKELTLVFQEEVKLNEVTTVDPMQSDWCLCKKTRLGHTKENV